MAPQPKDLLHSPGPTNADFLQVLQSPGQLRSLFLRAAEFQKKSSKNILKKTPASRLASAIWFDTMNRVVQGVAASPLQSSRECGAGCSFCCQFSAVDIMPLEAVVIADYVREHCSPAEIELLKSRLEASTDLRRKVSPLEATRLRMPCSLLGSDGLCSVYSARPFVCAGVFSASRAVCEAIFENRDLSQESPPYDSPARAWTMGVSGGLQRALSEARLDGNLYELNSAVLCAVNTPDAAAQWGRGEDVFADCHCTDSHSPPRNRLASWRIDSPSKPSSHFKNAAARRRRRKSRA